MELPNEFNKQLGPLHSLIDIFRPNIYRFSSIEDYLNNWHKMDITDKKVPPAMLYNGAAVAVLNSAVFSFTDSNKETGSLSDLGLSLDVELEPAKGYGSLKLSRRMKESLRDGDRLYEVTLICAPGSGSLWIKGFETKGPAGINSETGSLKIKLSLDRMLPSFGY